MVQKTTNYKTFKKIRGNRKIDRYHLNNLVLSIEKNNLLESNPIIVNEKMEVIDGQHRLKAAENLEVPIYYIVAKGTSIEDVQIMNTTIKRWGSLDYLESYVSRGFKDYILLKEFMANYSIPVLTALYLVTGKDDTRRGPYQDFKYGNLKITPEQVEEGHQLVRKLLDLSQYTYPKLYINLVFVRALKQVYKKISHDKLMEKLSLVSKKMERKTDIRGYIYQFEEFINFKQRNRITLY